LLKSGDENNLSNYRPISLVSPISKVFETCVKNILTTYLENKGYFSKTQHGFRKNKSVDTALLEHVTEIAKGIEHTEYTTIGVYLDFTKAFDTVNHVRLIQKLSEAGVGGKLLY
jgi:hypothetical protein